MAGGEAAQRPRERGLKGLPGVLAATLSTQAVASWAMLALAAIAPIVAESFGLPPVLIGYQIAIIYGVAMLVALVAAVTGLALLAKEAALAIPPLLALGRVGAGAAL